MPCLGLHLVAGCQVSAFIAKPYIASRPAVHSLPQLTPGMFRPLSQSHLGTGIYLLGLAGEAAGGRGGKSACNLAERTEGHHWDTKIGPYRYKPQSRGEGRDTTGFPPAVIHAEITQQHRGSEVALLPLPLLCISTNLLGIICPLSSKRVTRTIFNCFYILWKEGKGGDKR